MARLAYLDALGRDVPSIPSYVVGRRLVYWAADTKAFLEARREGRLGWLAWMRSWIGAPQAVFRWSDPMPSVAAWPGMLAKLVHRNGKGS